MSSSPAAANGAAPSRDELLALLAEIRPELHRYCARLTGSVFDGEDIVQSTLVRACDAIDADPSVIRHPRAWVFRVAHNQALDHLRRQARRAAEPLEAAAHLADESALDPAELLARQEASAAAIERFLLLPVVPRSVVILKDVLGQSLAEITASLDLSLTAAKAALHRGRQRLRELNDAAPTPPPPGPPSPETTRYVSLFNAREWPRLRAMLAQDVRLEQVSRAVLRGPVEASDFFTRYRALDDWHLVAARLEDREIAAVFTRPEDPAPAYFMEVRWRDGEITWLRDFRHARYVADGITIARP